MYNCAWRSKAVLKMSRACTLASSRTAQATPVKDKAKKKRAILTFPTQKQKFMEELNEPKQQQPQVLHLINHLTLKHAA